MTNCSKDAKTFCGCTASICNEYNYKVEETTKGIQISISPKDPTKVDSFKKTVKACRESCDCC